MKTASLLLVVLLVILAARTETSERLRANDTATLESGGSALASDEEAIKALIEKQTRLFFARDLAAYQDVWVHEPYVVRLWFDGQRVTGWDQVLKYYEQYFETYPDPVQDFFYEPYDMHIRVNGNLAWVINNQKIGGVVNNEAYTRNEWNSRILEKQDGEWKIVYNNTGLIDTPPAM